MRRDLLQKTVMPIIRDGIAGWYNPFFSPPPPIKHETNHKPFLEEQVYSSASNGAASPLQSLSK